MLTCTVTSFVDSFLFGLVTGVVGLFFGILFFYNRRKDESTNQGRMHG